MISSVVWLPSHMAVFGSYEQTVKPANLHRLPGFPQHQKSAGCSRPMMGCSQEVFSVPGSENTRPTQGNAFTCHIQDQHPVITQLRTQPEYTVLQLFPWHLLYRSSSGERGLALTYYISTATREVKTADYPALITSPPWEMLKWGLSFSLLILG